MATLLQDHDLGAHFGVGFRADRKSAALMPADDNAADSRGELIPS